MGQGLHMFFMRGHSNLHLCAASSAHFLEELTLRRVTISRGSTHIWMLCGQRVSLCSEIIPNPSQSLPIHEYAAWEAKSNIWGVGGGSGADPLRTKADFCMFQRIILSGLRIRGMGFKATSITRFWPCPCMSTFVACSSE